MFTADSAFKGRGRSIPFYFNGVGHPIGKATLPTHVQVNFLLSINESYSERGVPEQIQGILGFGFFKMTQCFIDCASERIFFLTNQEK